MRARPRARIKEYFSGYEFTGVHFTDEEKKFELHKLQRAIDADDMDDGILPYINRLNQLPWFVTLWSCTGHRGTDRGYVVFRIRKSFEEFLSIVQPFASRFRIIEYKMKTGQFSHLKQFNEIEINGLIYNRPGFMIRLRASTWDNELEFFVSLCENASLEKS
jgi:hypothetical protein